jgi:hypothetical protein
MKNANCKLKNGCSHAPILWPDRPKRDDTLVAQRRVWTSKCKRYRVVHSHIVYGEGCLPDVYYAEVFDPGRGGWDLLGPGRHRTKQAAMRHCEEDAKRIEDSGVICNG